MLILSLRLPQTTEDEERDNQIKNFRRCAAGFISAPLTEKLLRKGHSVMMVHYYDDKISKLVSHSNLNVLKHGKTGPRIGLLLRSNQSWGEEQAPTIEISPKEVSSQTHAHSIEVAESVPNLNSRRRRLQLSSARDERYNESHRLAWAGSS